jgi:hypothetical protein
VAGRKHHSSQDLHGRYLVMTFHNKNFWDLVARAGLKALPPRGEKVAVVARCGGIITICAYATYYTASLESNGKACAHFRYDRPSTST